MAEGGGLLNRYRGLNPYRGFESPSLRQFAASAEPASELLGVTEHLRPRPDLDSMVECCSLAIEDAFQANSEGSQAPSA